MKKVLLKDIAAKVGVSISLVSYVINNQEEEKKVNKLTADKIRKVARQMNYTPNQVAKSLKTNKTLALGLVVGQINYRYTAGIVTAIEAEAKKHNYTVFLGSSDEDKDKFGDLVVALVNRQVDGLILVPVEGCEQQLLDLKKTSVPFLLIDRYFPELNTNVIALDNFQSAFSSTEYLLNLGHKKVGFINYASGMDHLRERNRGYKEALQKNRIRAAAGWFQELNKETLEADTARAIDTMLSDKVRCDALFFATDTLAIYGLQYLNKIGVRIPEDVSVFSFDASDAFKLFYKPVTHTQQPLERMGAQAVSTLMNLINKQSIMRTMLFESTLVPGETCRE